LSISVEKELSPLPPRGGGERILSGPPPPQKGLASSFRTVSWPKNETRSESARKSDTARAEESKLFSSVLKL
jgi:hypothetical protein